MTPKQRHRLIRLVKGDGISVPRAAEKLGFSPSWARRCLRSAGIRGNGLKTLYAAYDRRTTALVVSGTAQELGRALRLSPATIRTYASSGKGRYHIKRLEAKCYDP